MATQIARKGRAVTVEIPEDLLRKANLSVGDAVEWTWGSTYSDHQTTVKRIIVTDRVENLICQVAEFGLLAP